MFDSWFTEPMGQTKEYDQLLATWARRVARHDHEAVGDRDDLDDALVALEANAALVQYLTSTRWVVVLQALEAGAGWDDLSSALGLSRGTVWALFCQQTDQLPHGGRDAARAAAIKDPLRGRRYR